MPLSRLCNLKMKHLWIQKDRCVDQLLVPNLQNLPNQGLFARQGILKVSTMVRPVILALGAIPAIVAILIAVPLITKSEIPFSAANSADVFEFEYTKHQLKKISFGITERLSPQKTEILIIKNDGHVTYSVSKDGNLEPEIKSTIDADKLNRLKAIIKETGFMTIPSESFPIMENVTGYQKSNVKITLNGQTNQIHWPEQNATEKFIPPIITMVESQLDQILKQSGE